MRLLLVIILIFFAAKLFAQDTFLEIDRVYGPDPWLYNGKKYIYFLPPGTYGNQFLISPDYFTGEVTLRGKRFEGVSLNYDIFNQKLLLQYADESGALIIIEVSDAWIENFRLGTMFFQYLSFDEGPQFYQVLGDDPLMILYFWRKEFKLDAYSGSSNFAFSPPIRSSFVLIGDKLQPFRNKRGLITLFEPGKKQEIRNYIRQNRIKVKKASDQVMTELINYIGNLK